MDRGSLIHHTCGYFDAKREHGENGFEDESEEELPHCGCDTGASSSGHHFAVGVGKVPVRFTNLDYRIFSIYRPPPPINAPPL